MIVCDVCRRDNSQVTCLVPTQIWVTPRNNLLGSKFVCEMDLCNGCRKIICSAVEEALKIAIRQLKEKAAP